MRVILFFILMANLPIGETSCRRTVLLAKRPVGEMSFRRTVLSAKCPVGELFVGELFVGEQSVGEVSMYPLLSRLYAPQDNNHTFKMRCVKTFKVWLKKLQYKQLQALCLNCLGNLSTGWLKSMILWQITEVKMSIQMLLRPLSLIKRTVNCNFIQSPQV